VAIDGRTSDLLDAEDRRKNAMSLFNQLVDEVRTKMCQTCYGDGEYDDAEPGDTFFNTIRCTACRGSGFKDGQAYQATPVPSGSIR
jgi:hypothetical protein